MSSESPEAPPARRPTPSWPAGHRFAFTIFDDPDSQTLEGGREVYALLRDLGFATTKAVWPLAPIREPSDQGVTCGDPNVVEWCRSLEADGFELAFHNATSHTCFREETAAGLDRFHELFGHHPDSMANHYYCDENMYWGDKRLTADRRLWYNLLTRGRNRNKYHGDETGHPMFWGDLCQDRIRYMRNFVFADINTLAACPQMPYVDPDRPFVNAWFAGTEGSNVESFVQTLSPDHQEALEGSGGACILYTHFGHGFADGTRLDPRFVTAMTALRERNGWFVPVTTLLDHLRSQQGLHQITARERRRLEYRWLMHKVRFGTA